jgi:hypothetical protein
MNRTGDSQPRATAVSSAAMRHPWVSACLVAAAASPANATSVKIVRNTSTLKFSYAWSTEAAAIPALRRWMQADAEKIFKREAASATSDARQADKSNYPFHQHEIQMSWETAGQSARLLSLEGSFWGFTGGAHGNGSTTALLWDRVRNVRSDIQKLLIAGQSWIGAIRQPFCILLDRERIKRRGGPLEKGGMFSGCPAYTEVTVVIADKNGNGRFDHIQVTADPYVAGPYVEGSYDIELPITAAMIARVKAEYRFSFEAQPPVQ